MYKLRVYNIYSNHVPFNPSHEKDKTTTPKGLASGFDYIGHGMSLVC